MNREKYINVKICPIKIYGISTGRIPIQVSNKKTLTKVQNIYCPIK